jgi:penicillin-binding protein 1A
MLRISAGSVLGAQVFRILFATLRLCVRMLGRVLGFRKPRSARPSLPGSFHSVAQQAFDFGEEPKKKPTRRRGNFLSRAFGRLNVKYRVLFGLGVLGAGVTMLSFAVMMVYYTVVFPDPHAIGNNERAPLIRILARDGSTLAERGASHVYVRLSDMPKVIPAAVVATEDRRFFDHYGVDPGGMLRAMFTNLRAGRYVQGGSTLTQQLAKNLFLTQERTLSRKIAELGLAFWLEVRLTKDEILELYLNQVYFGSGAYGVGAASERYFGKPASKLTLPEAAIIAGLLKAPSKYSPSTNPDGARARGRVVLSKMLDAGFISPDQERRALAQPVVFTDPNVTTVSADTGYVVDYILDQMPPISSTGNGDVVIQTTLDPILQQAAQKIVKETLDKKGAAFGANQAALVVIDGDGDIRALVGGRDYTKSQFDRAVKAKRQPGSAFKPFVYLAALEHGMTPDTVVFDGPITIGSWSPKNDDNKYVGPVTLRQALTRSINTVAVRLNQDVGQGHTIEVAQRLGIRSDLHEGPSLALGTSEVSLLEMSGAYAVFSNGGSAVEPHVISRISLSSGRVIYVSPPPRTDKIVSLDHIGALNDMLNAVVVSGTGRRAALPDYPAAGKTGTTQDFRDAWFIGYTSHLTAGVWVGNDDGKPMIRTTGGSLPAEIWNKVMRIANAGKIPSALPGTTFASLDADAFSHLDGHGSSASARSRVPRVVQYHEVLPWARQAPSGLIANASAPGLSHPMNSIGEDFIARAVADSSTSRSQTISEREPDRPQDLSSIGNWW